MDDKDQWSQSSLGERQRVKAAYDPDEAITPPIPSAPPGADMAARNATHLMSVASTDREPNRWAVLALLSVAQLMLVLDVTIVTIAIPSAQKALCFSTESRQWIVTAYASQERRLF
jgi:hypothetical protein